jgi:hypothetical protein
MSFLDRIFERKRDEEPEEKRISLKDLEDSMAKKVKIDFEPLKEAAKKEYANLQLLATSMQNQLKILENATYPERTYPVIISKSVGSRKSFISKMNFLINQIKKPIGEDMKSILEFYDETNKLINITNAETTKEYAFLKILFEKDGKEVVHNFSQIVEANKNLGEIVKKIRDSNSELLKSKEGVAEVLRLTEYLKKDEVRRLEELIKDSEEKIKKIENEIEKLISSDEWKAFLEMQRVKEELKTKMENKKSDFMTSMSKIEIPLKRYKLYVEKRIMDEYIQKSFDSILYEDPKGEILMSVLKDMKIRIIEGEMKLKDSDKFMTIINDFKENNTVGRIIEDYSRLSEDLKSQEEKISLQRVSKRKNYLESEFSRLKREIEELKNDRKIAEERMKKMQANREQKIKELENLLQNVYGQKILLEVN